MSGKGNAPIIIKKKKVIAGGGHHGGAWKVAYADFVTAMMAFFLLMWLLNATTEKQRKGLADYFNPTIPVNRISGGGDGSFGGDSVFTEETLSQNGTGASNTHSANDSGAAKSESTEDEDTAEALEAKAFADVQELLTAFSGESMAADEAMRHIVTRVTDEGLIIELHDLDDEPLFSSKSSEPSEVMDLLVEMLSEVFKIVRNDIAVSGYVRSQPLVVADNPVWDLSTKRADQVRLLLEKNGTPSARIQRVTGYADRKPAVGNPMAARNNRVEIVLLRKQIKK
ncbi:MAG: flagellar motor protein MotB [Rhodobacteraceae bacterium]|uniref:OmpA/MotB family protein n=1 Tax=Celeribacter sp. HF31 TaxID=2721558 RepID=UPI0014313B8F|nr:flagellar motor protein MotB [Celeribacter sp. HF31]NIY79336.1 flagellar motor protein MotB [Celeribacter sp. HF31]NVK45724.1 flagellar motor protein MotB [Paracoccaceae bacterium]